MKYALVLSVVIFFSNLSQAQKVTYSSSKKYQNIRLAVKYPTVVKKVESKDSDVVAFVQMPFINTKKVTYGSLISVAK
ncbi:MAG: hypothetical protein CFE22_18075 [Cytophagaceae bacterium BCCC1]|jgi:hypothetical protein|nr:MAG: hypothetical protein CFE22_18075 [Cytophagaceae bacterium BCCC1]